MLIEVSLINKERITVFEDTTAKFVLRRGAFTVFQDFGYFVSEECASDIWLVEGLK